MSDAARQSQGGFTIVEVMVAGLLLLIGSLGDAEPGRRVHPQHLPRRAEPGDRQPASDRDGEDQADPVRGGRTDRTPAHSTDPADPAWRVSGSQFATSPSGTGLRPMVVNGGTLAAGGTISDGTLSPAPTPFESGDVSGTIQRYVVWINDPKCPETLCPGDQDLKRVIVAATINDTASGGVRPYQELQGDIVDPDVKPVDNPVPPGTGDEGTFATFWLTDTPCDEPERLPLTGNHDTHNTLGTCDDGLLTGLTGGAPDLMYVEQPFLDPNYPDDEQPLYDYSTDVEPRDGRRRRQGAPAPEAEQHHRQRLRAEPAAARVDPAPEDAPVARAADPRRPRAAARRRGDPVAVDAHHQRGRVPRPDLRLALHSPPERRSGCRSTHPLSISRSQPHRASRAVRTTGRAATTRRSRSRWTSSRPRRTCSGRAARCRDQRRAVGDRWRRARVHVRPPELRQPPAGEDLVGPADLRLTRLTSGAPQPMNEAMASETYPRWTRRMIAVPALPRRRDPRQLRDRARPPPPARRELGLGAVAMPRVRRADPRPRQRPDRLVARAARALPRLRRADLVALPAGRARARRAVRGART